MASLLQRGNALLLSEDGARWWTYAGGSINHTQRYALAELPCWTITSDNFHLRIEGAGVSQTAVVAAIEKLAAPEFWDDDRVWQKIIARVPSYRLSRFQDALPPRYQLELLGRYLLDLEGARRFAGGAPGAAPAERVAGLLSRIISSFPTAAPGSQAPALPAARLERAIRYIDTDAALATLCEHLRGRPAIGLDVETTLVERELCLIQIGAEDYNAVIDPRAPIDLLPRVEILESVATTKIIHNATFERGVLLRPGAQVLRRAGAHVAARRWRRGRIEACRGARKSGP